MAKSTMPATSLPFALREGQVDFNIARGTVLLDQHIKVPVLDFCSPSRSVRQSYDVSVADVTATDTTRTTLKLTKDKIDLTFSPPLRVNVWGPWQWVSFSGLTYEFGDAQKQTVGQLTTKVEVEKIVWPFRVPLAFDWTRQKVDKEIRAWFQDLIKNTVYADPGYNPMLASDPMAGLNQLKTKIQSGSSQGNAGATADALSNISGGVTISNTSPILKEAAGGAIYIPQGGEITITVHLLSSANQIANKLVRINWIDITGKGIFLRKGNRDVAELNEIQIDRGGAVWVKSYTPLGEVKQFVDKAGSAETFIRFLDLLFAVREAPSSERYGILHSTRDPAEIVQPRIATHVPSVVLNEALTNALRTLYRQNYAAISQALPVGFDLDKILGMGSDGMPVK